ncbi:hypothetical protein V8E54_013357 [Elaphomyces granulatus]
MPSQPTEKWQDADSVSSSDFEPGQPSSTKLARTRTQTLGLGKTPILKERTCGRGWRFIRRKAERSQNGAPVRMLLFCLKVKTDPIEILRQCEADTFKTYLEWRVKNS